MRRFNLTMEVELSNKKGYLNALVLAVFMLSGLLKSFIQFIPVPSVDITLLSAAMMVGCFLLNSKDRVFLTANSFTMLWFFLAFTFFILLSLFYTKSEEYGFQKAFLWLTCVLGFLFPLFNFINIRVFSYVIIFFSLSLSLIHSFIFSFFDLTLLSQELKYIVYGVYLDLGYFLGFSIFLCLYLHSLVTKSFERYFVTFLGVLAFFMLFSSGARGPFLFTAILLLFRFIWFFISGIKFTRKSLIVFYICSCFLCLSVLFKITVGNQYEAELGKQIERSVFRLSLIFNDDRGSSINTRFKHLDESFYNIDLKPILGHGFGSYGIVTTGIDQKAFPHNMFLEAWFEIGLFGLLTLMIFTSMSLIKSAACPPLFLLNLFIVANQMKSSNLSDSRVYFSIVGIILFLSTFNTVRTLAAKRLV